MFEQVFINIVDVLWKVAGCTSKLDYTGQSSWLLFLKYLDALEHDKATEVDLEGRKYQFIPDGPYRWHPPNPAGAAEARHLAHRGWSDRDYGRATENTYVALYSTRRS